jgi:Protein of unknown function (DUF3153)
MLLKRTIIRARSGWLQRIRRWLAQTRILLVILLTSLLLVGCVDYDLGISFDSPNRGAIAQTVQLDDRFYELTGKAAQEWLSSLEQRTRELQGKVERISETELRVTIPFYSGGELEDKFNQFFNPNEDKNQPVAINEEVPFGVYLNLNQNNLLLLLRNRLSYDLDLRSLSGLSADSNVVINGDSSLNLEFSLNTPWGARSVTKAENAVRAENKDNGHQLIWHLQPGQINHVEAVFWLPNPLGIGAVVIALLIAAGLYLKYTLRLGSKTIFVPPATPEF